MFKCMPFLCNRHVEYVNKSNCNLSSVPDEVLRYGRTLEELLLDNNQIKDLPKVCLLHVLLVVLNIPACFSTCAYQLNRFQER